MLMTILSKTSNTVKQTKPTEHFFETHFCHVRNEKFKNASFGFAVSIYMPLRCGNKNSGLIEWNVTKFCTGIFR